MIQIKEKKMYYLLKSNQSQFHYGMIQMEISDTTWTRKDSGLNSTMVWFKSKKFVVIKSCDS